MIKLQQVKPAEASALKRKKRDFFPLPQIKEDKAFNEPYFLSCRGIFDTLFQAIAEGQGDMITLNEEKNKKYY